MTTTQTINKQRPENGGQGMNWIRPAKRLAIYLRDGLACVWCGQGLEAGVRFTLDHRQCRANGINNDPTNLLTACHTCNSSRGKRSVATFARATAAYLNHGVKASDIIGHINVTRKRALDVAAAKAIIEKRGGFSAAMKGLK
jgi:hypothetical protein